MSLDLAALKWALESVWARDSCWESDNHGDATTINEGGEDYGYSICEIECGEPTEHYIGYLMAVQPRNIRALIQRLEAAEAVLCDSVRFTEPTCHCGLFHGPGKDVNAKYDAWIAAKKATT